jgi:NOL1/NOP2/sun family putative RNA methylase
MRIEKLFSRYESIILDFRPFMDTIKKPLFPSFRINTLKAERKEILALLKDLKLKSLPFYDDGFCLVRKYPIGNHITHNLGLIYAQETASMIPPILLEPQPGDVILDLCAAPGSKATQIAQMMKNKGLLVLNEPNRKRTQSLIHNIKRCGVLNEVVINLRGEKIDRVLPEYFDRILIDAPCSAEGTIRKSKAVLYHWGLKNIVRMARIQKGLVVSGFRALQSGGIMVYSTCTIAPEENEGVIAYLLQKFPEAEVLPVTLHNFKTRPGITKWQGETFDKRVKNCLRILPQDNNTAPFFIAQITKRGIYKHRPPYIGKIEFEGAITEHFCRRFGIGPDRFKGYSIFQSKGTSFITTPEVYSFRGVNATRKGLEFGKIYNQEVKPDNDFVQIFGKQAKENAYEIEEWQLPKFLKGEIIKIHARSKPNKGFIIVTYKNLPIGVGRYNDKELKSEIKRERRIPQ